MEKQKIIQVRQGFQIINWHTKDLDLLRQQGFSCPTILRAFILAGEAAAAVAELKALGESLKAYKDHLGIEVDVTNSKYTTQWFWFQFFLMAVRVVCSYIVMINRYPKLGRDYSSQPFEIKYCRLELLCA